MGGPLLPRDGARRVLVVGAGLSGAAAAWCLARRAAEGSLEVHCWDGARGCGGRLATARIAVGGGGSAAEAKANMGAQRLHHHAVRDAPAMQVAELLCGAGVLEPEAEAPGRDESIVSYVATGSSNEVCKWLLREAGAELRTGARIRSISRAGGGWDVTAFGDKAPCHFDAVVFGGSVAEVCTTHGDFTELVRPHRRQLQAVHYTRACCAAMVLPGSGPAAKAVRRFFGAHRSRPGAAGGELKELVLQPTGADSEHLTVVAVSTDRHGQSVKGLRATHRPSAQDLKVSGEVEDALIRGACTLMAGGDGAAALHDAVVATKMNFWKFAQIAKPLTGADCLVVSRQPPLAICGDYFQVGGPHWRCCHPPSPLPEHCKCLRGRFPPNDMSFLTGSRRWRVCRRLWRVCQVSGSCGGKCPGSGARTSCFRARSYGGPNRAAKSAACRSHDSRLKSRRAASADSWRRHDRRADCASAQTQRNWHAV